MPGLAVTATAEKPRNAAVVNHVRFKIYPTLVYISNNNQLTQCSMRYVLELPIIAFKLWSLACHPASEFLVHHWPM
jgi:hypothetical protein